MRAPRGVSDFSVIPTVPFCQKLQRPDASRHYFDDGASLVSYLGHGRINLLDDENDFDNTDVPLLSPQTQQPFVFTMNCLNGFFTLAYFDALNFGYVSKF